MPPLFTSNRKIKVIEYGQHASDDIDLKAVKRFFAKILRIEKQDK